MADLSSVFHAPPCYKKIPIGHVATQAMLVMEQGGHVKIQNHTGLKYSSYYGSNEPVPPSYVFVKHPCRDLWQEYWNGLPRERCQGHSTLATESNVHSRIKTLFRRPHAYMITLIDPQHRVRSFNRSMVGMT